jgi:hypothetical protein
MPDRAGLWGFSVPGETSYFSRFAVKFVEIIAAGVATAVSGYMIAHLSGYWAAPLPAPAAVTAPAAIQSLARPDAAKTVVVTPRAQPAAAPAAPIAPAETTAPAAAAAPPAPPAPRAAATAPATSARKHPTAAAGASESKPREKEAAEAKPREKDADAKAREKDDKEAVEAQVRAALANVDASRPAPTGTPPRAAEIPPAAPAAAAPPAQPRPLEAGPMTTGAIAAPPAPPRAPEALPRAPQAAPQSQAAIEPVPQTPPAPGAPAPLAPVEITSRPVADVAAPTASPAAAPDGTQQAGAPDDAKADKGLLATIKKIPELLRPTAGATTSEPPRPPLPVGEQ